MENMAENDDLPVGNIFSRREMLVLFGAAGAAFLSACAPQLGGIPRLGGAVAAGTPVAVAGCIVTPAQTEGPYFVDEKLNRSDIRSDPADGTLSAGSPLQLVLRVSQVGSNSCTPLAGALVDVWHCDAQGVYSDVNDPSGSTKGKQFLRGYQTTDAKGAAQFTTIYPGWYPGRAVHIHFKVRSDPTTSQGFEFTSQLFFDDTFTDQVYTQAPYASRGQRNTRNANDNIFSGVGDQMIAAVKQDGAGYTATFDIGVMT